MAESPGLGRRTAGDGFRDRAPSPGSKQEPAPKRTELGRSVIHVGVVREDGPAALQDDYPARGSVPGDASSRQGTLASGESGRRIPEGVGPSRVAFRAGNYGGKLDRGGETLRRIKGRFRRFGRDPAYLGPVSDRSLRQRGRPQAPRSGKGNGAFHRRREKTIARGTCRRGKGGGGSRICQDADGAGVARDTAECGGVANADRTGETKGRSGRDGSTD